ncbi:hypothetical protein Bbelb_132130, partial [Branchiostoma belcheri]
MTSGVMARVTVQAVRHVNQQSIPNQPETYPGGHDYVIHSFELDGRLRPYFAPYSNHELHCPTAVSDTDEGSTEEDQSDWSKALGEMTAFSESAWSPDKGKNNGVDMQWGGGSLFVSEDEKKDTDTGGLRKLSYRRAVPTVDLSRWIQANFAVEDDIVFKLDVEGAEYAILKKMLKDGTFRWIDKFYGEFHPWQPTGLSWSEKNQLLDELAKKKITQLSWAAEVQDYQDIEELHQSKVPRGTSGTAGTVYRSCGFGSPSVPGRVSLVIEVGMNAKMAHRLIEAIRAYRVYIPLSVFVYGDFAELFPEMVLNWSLNHTVGVREGHPYPPGHFDIINPRWIRTNLIISVLRLHELGLQPAFYLPASTGKDITGAAAQRDLRVVYPTARFPPTKERKNCAPTPVELVGSLLVTSYKEVITENPAHAERSCLADYHRKGKSCTQTGPRKISRFSQSGVKLCSAPWTYSVRPGIEFSSYTTSKVLTCLRFDVYQTPSSELLAGVLQRKQVIQGGSAMCTSILSPTTCEENEELASIRPSYGDTDLPVPCMSVCLSSCTKQEERVETDKNPPGPGPGFEPTAPGPHADALTTRLKDLDPSAGSVGAASTPHICFPCHPAHLFSPEVLLQYQGVADITMTSRFPYYPDTDRREPNFQDQDFTWLYCYYTGAVLEQNGYWFKLELNTGSGQRFTSARNTGGGSNPRHRRVRIWPYDRNDNPTHLTNAYSCLGRQNGVSDKVITFKMREDADVRPRLFSRTVNVGDAVTLEMVQNPASTRTGALEWRKNGAVLQGQTALTLNINNVQSSDEGIYECYYGGAYSDRKQGIMRLIVRACAENKYGSDCSNDCPDCYNGGVCHDQTGECVCPPGFSGTFCETACASGRFGKTCRFSCSGGCQGQLMTVPDPVGCTCPPGLTGMTCQDACPDGTYGASCTQSCHCLSGNSACNKGTGACTGGCAAGWAGDSCQIRPATVTQHPMDQTIDVGGQVTFTCSSTGVPTPAITWYNDSSAITRGQISDNVIEVIGQNYAVTSILTITSVGREDNGVYKCASSNANGVYTVTSQAARLTVREHPDDVTLSVNAVNSTALQVTWTVGLTGNLDILDSRVRHRGFIDGEWTPHSPWRSTGISGTNGTVRISGLLPAVTYQVQVIVRNALGWSRPPSWAYGTTDEA